MSETKKTVQKKGRKEPRKEKINMVEETAKLIKEYPIVGIVNIYKLPANAFMAIKNELYGKAEISVIKKRMLKYAIEKVPEKKELLKYLDGQPALMLTRLNPFKIYKIIQKSKSSAPAKTGDIAPEDIVVKAGPTDLPPGPAISTLAKAKVRGKVEAGKIAIINDVTVCKKGEPILKDVATVLGMLKMKPIKIGLDVPVLFENGIYYLKDVLDIDEEKVLSDLTLAIQHALNLSVEACYPTKDNIQIMIQKSFREAKEISLAGKLTDKNIIGEELEKALSEEKK